MRVSRIVGVAPPAAAPGVLLRLPGRGLLAFIAVGLAWWLVAALDWRQPRLVERYLAVQREALAFMARDPEAALTLAAQEQRISIDEARRMLPWYDFTPRMTDQDIRNMEQNQVFMIDNGMLQRRIDVRRDLVNDMAFAA